jgi:hypothetical protein
MTIHSLTQRLALLSLLAALAACGGGSSAPAGPPPVPPPTLTTFTPSAGVVGSTVAISGTSFKGVTGVKFNGTPDPTFIVTFETQLMATVPVGATTGPITVTSATGVATSAASFTVTLPVPVITGFSPLVAPTGASVVITGTGFLGATQVDFNGALDPSFRVDNGTQITARVPPGTPYGPISVTTPGGRATSSAGFTLFVPPPPALTSFFPLSGPVGATVVLTGKGLSDVTSLTFAGIPDPTFRVDGPTQITATVPTGALSGRISVTSPTGPADTASAFTVTAGGLGRLTYVNPAPGPFQLVLNAALSTADHLVLDLVGPAATLGIGVSLTLSVDPAFASWATVSGQEYVANGQVFFLDADPRILQATVTGGTIQAVVAQKGLSSPRSLGGVLLRLALDRRPGTVGGVGTAVSFSADPARCRVLLGDGSLVPLAPSLGQLQFR